MCFTSYSADYDESYIGCKKFTDVCTYRESNVRYRKKILRFSRMEEKKQKGKSGFSYGFSANRREISWMFPADSKSAITMTVGDIWWRRVAPHRILTILITGVKANTSQASRDAKRQNQFRRWPNTSASRAYLSVCRCLCSTTQFHSHVKSDQCVLSARRRHTHGRANKIPWLYTLDRHCRRRCRVYSILGVCTYVYASMHRLGLKAFELLHTEAVCGDYSREWNRALERGRKSCHRIVHSAVYKWNVYRRSSISILLLYVYIIIHLYPVIT